MKSSGGRGHSGAFNLADAPCGQEMPLEKENRQRGDERQREEHISRGRRRWCEKREKVGRLRVSFESELALGL